MTIEVLNGTIFLLISRTHTGWMFLDTLDTLDTLDSGHTGHCGHTGWNQWTVGGIDRQVLGKSFPPSFYMTT